MEDSGRTPVQRQLCKFAWKIIQATMTAHITELPFYDVILGKPWLTDHNPDIKWRSNSLSPVVNTCSLRKPQRMGMKPVAGHN